MMLSAMYSSGDAQRPGCAELVVLAAQEGLVALVERVERPARYRVERGEPVLGRADHLADHGD